MDYSSLINITKSVAPSVMNSFKGLVDSSYSTINDRIQERDMARLLGSDYVYKSKELDKTSNILGSLGFLTMGADKYANLDLSGVEDKFHSELDKINNSQISESGSFNELMNNMASHKAFSTDYKAEDYYGGPDGGQMFSNITNSIMQGATAGSAINMGIGTAIGAGVGLLTGITGSILGKQKAKNFSKAAAGSLRRAAYNNNQHDMLAFNNNALNLDTKNNRTLMSQVGISAYGGPLGVSLTPVNGAIDFMQNEELLSSLREDTTKNNSRRISMPMFAFGGALGGYGGDWSNGLNYKVGEIYDVSEEEIKRLKQQGYKFEYV